MPRKGLIAVFALLLFGMAGWLAFDRWVTATELPNLLPRTSVVVEDRQGHLLRAYTVADGRWRLPASLDDIDPGYVVQLIAFEDKRFYRHHGVDPFAMLRAVAQAIWYRRLISGGSTLTMQVARLLEQGGTGRWHDKFRQIRVALALERRLNKSQILELYLQLAPYGGNLEGVRAASLSYFGKEPSRLTPAQSALLVALPQAPETRRPDRAPDAARAGRDRVLARMVGAGVLSANAARAARGESVPKARIAFPVIAAHMADRAVAERPGAAMHRLTLDRRLQQALEKLVLATMADKPPGLSAAIVVADHQTGEVLASVGSAAYLDHDRGGFLDMTRAVRSPGSTLKPLIYGLGFEQGFLHPETLIEDQATDFSGYAPANFDGRYHGWVTVRHALGWSLNIPAVMVLEKLGPANLLARMRRAGVRAVLPGSDPPGLAIGLGGMGISLEDLVTLYAAIARGGEALALVHRPAGVGPGKGGHLLTAEAAWQVGDILRGVASPDLAPDGDLAFKTGTSYGYRDAWAVGFDGRHVIGVWLGRPDGASVPGILGADLAAPLLFQAFARLKPKLVPLAAPPPATLLLAHQDLPGQLRRFYRGEGRFLALNGPEIDFPPDGARLELATGGQPLPLVIKVRNGTPPFTFFANGVPFLIARHQRQAELPVPKPGFLKLAVVDAMGQAERIEVELRPSQQSVLSLGQAALPTRR